MTLAWNVLTLDIENAKQVSQATLEEVQKIGVRRR